MYVGMYLCEYGAYMNDSLTHLPAENLLSYTTSVLPNPQSLIPQSLNVPITNLPILLDPMQVSPIFPYPSNEQLCVKHNRIL